MKRSEFLHHNIVPLWHIRMYSLRVLTEVVEAREGLTAMAAEGAFSRMLTDVACEVLAASEDHAAVTETAALEHGHVARCTAITLGICGLLRASLGTSATRIDRV